MANTDIQISVRCRWFEQPGEGGACFVCGENIYLSQARLFTSYGTGSGGWSPWEPSKVVVCHSCHDFGEQDLKT